MAKRTHFVKCPVCGFGRTIKKQREIDSAGIVFDDESYLILTRDASGGKIPGARTGRGRAKGSGFPRIDDECLTITETVENEEFDKTIEIVKKNLLNAVELFIRNDIITREELAEL